MAVSVGEQDRKAGVHRADKRIGRSEVNADNEAGGHFRKVGHGGENLATKGTKITKSRELRSQTLFCNLCAFCG